MQLDGKVVAVTGGSGGLGHILCGLLAKAGALVVVVDLVPPKPEVAFIETDLSSQEGILSGAGQLAAFDVDVLINLAGVQHFGQIEAQPDTEVVTTYMVNLVAPVLLTRALLPAMRRKGRGLIVNIGSAFASIPFAHFATYSSSKAGLKAFSEALRREVSPAGIRVTYVSPRAIRTPMNGSKVMQFAAATRMAMDPPQLVAGEVLAAILGDKSEVHVGFPESLFARVNAIVPRLVDRALIKNDTIARRILSANEP